MGRYLDLIKDTIVIGFGNIFSKGILFILVPLYTSCMSKADFGLAELFYNIVNVLMPVFSFGIAEATMRFSINNLDKRNSIFLISTCIPFVGIIPIYFLSIPILEKFPMYGEYFIHLLGLYICFSLKDIYLFFAKGIGALSIFSKGSMCFAFALAVSSYYFLALEKMGVKGYLYSFIVANLFTIVYLWYYGKFYQYISLKHISFDKSLLIEMLAYSTPLMSNAIAWWVNNLSNRYVLAYYTSLENVGVFSALAKFASILTAVFGVFFQSWQINAVKYIDSSEKKEYFSNVYCYYTMAIIFGTIIVMPVAKLMLPYFIRGDFDEAYRYLPCVLITGTMGCLPMYWGAIYGALKNTKGAFYSTLSGSLVNVVLNFLLIPIYGIYGAVVSTVISYSVITSYRIIDINKNLKIDLGLRKHLLAMAILFLQVLAFSFFEQLIEMLVFNISMLILLMLLYYQNIVILFYSLKR